MSDKALRYAEQIAYSSKEVLRFTYDMAVKYKDSPGVYVECGVAAGAQIIAMAAGTPRRMIYAFDSFKGISLPSNRDNQMPGIRFLSKEEQASLPEPGEQVLSSSGATVVSEKDFWDHVHRANVPMSMIRTVPGWFEETVPKWAEENKEVQISILRLDGDLYNSTYVCLKHLYPKVMKGGIIIIDDWALPGCRQAVFDWSEHNPLYVMGIKLQFIEDKNSTVAYWTK